VASGKCENEVRFTRKKEGLNYEGRNEALGASQNETRKSDN
jgi:hypothetical protein